MAVAPQAIFFASNEVVRSVKFPSQITKQPTTNTVAAAKAHNISLPHEEASYINRYKQTNKNEDKQCTDARQLSYAGRYQGPYK
mmetsp:Transcript_14596/g.21579  ORF Transcript_14596/g.21579 Transcript_14596/m.21579 type:complete len:84 (+) Transcript_14596:17-268(+)